MIQHTTHLSPYLTGKHMAHFGGTLRGLPYGPGPAQDAAIVGFNDGMAERSERNAPPPLVDVELNDSNGWVDVELNDNNGLDRGAN